MDAPFEEFYCVNETEVWVCSMSGSLALRISYTVSAAPGGRMLTSSRLTRIISCSSSVREQPEG